MTETLRVPTSSERIGRCQALAHRASRESGAYPLPDRHSDLHVPFHFRFGCFTPLPPREEGEHLSPTAKTPLTFQGRQVPLVKHKKGMPQ